jgi:tetratricopeptide (TPR) repeat protein
VGALAREREASSPASAQTDREKLLNCLAESEFLVAAGDLASAQRVLKQATGLAPTDDDVRRRLMMVNESIDAAQANALLERALRGAPNAVELARRATQLRPARDVLLRSLGVFARAGAHDEIADVAEQLLELDPNDEGALRTLLDANISMERWTVAAQAAQALVRKHPQDVQLQEKLQKVLQQARRPV